MLTCRLKPDSREPTGTGRAGITTSHQPRHPWMPVCTGAPLGIVTSAVTEAEEQDRSLEVGGSHAQNMSSGIHYHVPPQWRWLATLMASQPPRQSPVNTPLALQTLVTLNNEHIPLCLVPRAAPGSCHTATVLDIPKDQGHCGGGRGEDIQCHYPNTASMQQCSYPSQESVRAYVCARSECVGALTAHLLLLLGSRDYVQPFAQQCSSADKILLNVKQGQTAEKPSSKGEQVAYERKAVLCT